jgi:hypothetical protein
MLLLEMKPVLAETPPSNIHLRAIECKYIEALYAFQQSEHVNVA